VWRDGEGGFRVDALWSVSGSVDHLGHVHNRQNRYEAALRIRPLEGVRKITDVEIRDERRVLEPGLYDGRDSVWCRSRDSPLRSLCELRRADEPGPSGEKRILKGKRKGRRINLYLIRGPVSFPRVTRSALQSEEFGHPDGHLFFGRACRLRFHPHLRVRGAVPGR
jgi:hypothetical protein